MRLGDPKRQTTSKQPYRTAPGDEVGTGGCVGTRSTEPSRSFVDRCTVGWAQWRNLRRADEYQRIAHLEAMSVGLAVALFVALTGGLLDIAGIASSAQLLQVTFVTGIVSWVIALAIRTRR